MVGVACRAVALARNVPESVFVIPIVDTTLGEGFAFACYVSLQPHVQATVEQRMRQWFSGDDPVSQRTSVVWSKVLQDVPPAPSAGQHRNTKG